MSGAILYPQVFLRLRRAGSKYAMRILDDNSPTEEDVVRAQWLSLSYTDDENAADVLKVTFNDFDLSYMNEPWCKPGDEFRAKWGYPGNMSGQVFATVTKVKHTGTTVQFEATGKEYLLNRIVRPRTWRNVRRSDVVRAIANEYGYASNAEIHDSELVYPTIIQAKLTDHQMVAELAKREGWIFYIDEHGLYFGPRPLHKAPLKTIRYYLQTQGGDLMSYPTIDADLFARPGAVTAKGSDPKTGKEFKVTANDATTAGRPTVGGTVEVVDRQNGKQTYQSETVATEATVATTATNKADAQRAVNAIYQSAQLGAVKVTLPLVGDPGCRAKAVFALADVGQQLVGKVYLTQVTHTLTASSYTVSAKGRREALAGGAGGAGAVVGKGSPNKQAAPAPGQEKTDKLEPREVVDNKTGTTHVEYR